MPSAVASSEPVAPSMLTCGSVRPSRPRRAPACRRPCAGTRGSRRGPGRRWSSAPFSSPNVHEAARHLRGRPASSSGAASGKSSCFWTSATPFDVRRLALRVDAGRRVDLGHLRARGRRGVDLRRPGSCRRRCRSPRARAPGPVVALGVDRGAQRHAAGGVPGELGRAEQPAVVLGRDPHGVARRPAVVRRRARRRASTAWPSLARPSWTPASVAGSAWRRRACSSCGSAPGEGRLRGRVVEQEALAVGDDLGVAVARTAARAAAGRRWPATGARSAPVSAGEAVSRGQRAGGEQVVGELDAGGDALDGRAR